MAAKWLVLLFDKGRLDHFPFVTYQGPDKKKALFAAANSLAEGKTGSIVQVNRVTASVTLTRDRLVQVLPRDAF